MKINFFPYQAHCFAFGGFEIQMLSAFDALQKIGVDCRKTDFWSRDNSFDIAHFWGFGFPHYENFRWAKTSKKKIVMTVLLPYQESRLSGMKLALSRLVHRQRFLYEQMQLAHRIVVVNDVQKNVCCSYYRMPPEKVAIIPNIVTNNFFEAPASVPSKEKPYILSTGNICRRKNQVALCKAAIRSSTDLVIIGKILPGEEAYANEFRALAESSPNIRWIPGLDANSGELAGYYHGCAGFALPSYEETQPISLLEARACRKPLLTADRPYAKQSFYSGAITVDPDSVDSISRGLQLLRSKGEYPVSGDDVIFPCRDTSVAEAYKNVYAGILNE